MRNGIGGRGLCVLATLSVLVFPAACAAADPPRPPAAAPGEHVTRLDVSLHVSRDGAVRVREDYRYDFGSAARSRFTRLLTDEGSWGGIWTNGLKRIRAYGVPPGPVATRDYGRSSTDGGRVLVTVGPPHGRAAFTGTHRFVVEYDLHVRTSPELDFSAVSAESRVPIRAFRTTITGAARLSGVQCRIEDPEDAWDRERDCDRQWRTGPRRVVVEEAGLAAERGVDVVVGFPDGDVRPAYGLGSYLLLVLLLVLAAGSLLGAGILVVMLLGRRRPASGSNEGGEGEGQAPYETPYEPSFDERGSPGSGTGGFGGM